jgi:hypothetical protein
MITIVATKNRRENKKKFSRKNPFDDNVFHYLGVIKIIAIDREIARTMQSDCQRTIAMQLILFLPNPLLRACELGYAV